MPAISILLPVWNGAAYLEAQIDSIVAQSFTDWELLVVDDGSGDDSVAIARRLADREPRIRILEASGNEGQNRRLAQLRDAATGPLIAISDQDDLWDADKLMHLHAAIGNAPLAYGRSLLVDAEDRPLGGDLLDRLGGVPAEGERLRFLFRSAVSGHAMLVRRDCLTDAALSRSLFYDGLVALDAAFAGPVRHVPAAITRHRIHDAAQSSNKEVVAAAPARLTRLRRSAGQTLFERWVFAQRLEHLAHSPVAAPDVRTTARQALRLCEAAWFLPDRPARIDDRALVERLLALLAPYAGSPADLAFARQELTRYARSPLHPRSLAGALRRLLG